MFIKNGPTDIKFFWQREIQGQLKLFVENIHFCQQLKQRMALTNTIDINVLVLKRINASFAIAVKPENKIIFFIII